MILTECAGEITPRRPKAQHWRPGQEMVEWFFLNRIDTASTGAAVGGKDDLVPLPTAHKTQPPLPIAQFTKTRADVALNTPILDRMPVPPRHRIGKRLVNDWGTVSNGRTIRDNLSSRNVSPKVLFQTLFYLKYNYNESSTRSIFNARVLCLSLIHI